MWSWNTKHLSSSPFHKSSENSVIILLCLYAFITHSSLSFLAILSSIYLSSNSTSVFIFMCSASNSLYSALNFSWSCFLLALPFSNLSTFILISCNIVSFIISFSFDSWIIGNNRNGPHYFFNKKYTKYVKILICQDIVE